MQLPCFQDEIARLTMCESQAWLPIASLFGLLGCPVPLRLKAQILSTLAAFAKSPEIASSLWHTLELSQVGLGIMHLYACKLLKCLQ